MQQGSKQKLEGWGITSPWRWILGDCPGSMCKKAFNRSWTHFYRQGSKKITEILRQSPLEGLWMQPNVARCTASQEACKRTITADGHKKFTCYRTS